ncbi:MAG: hypothetical protein J5J06_18960 [Phycisphaerae bacterium]|nr:hypothetical protein [Phycisphaerae bacterium]
MRAIVVDEPLLIWALDELRDRTATAAKIRANLRKLLEYAWGSNTLYGHESDYCDVLVEDASIETEYILDGDVALHATVLVRIPFSAHVFAGMKHFPLQFEDESIRIETDDGRDTKTRGVARFHRFGAWSGDRYHNRFGVPYVFHQGDYDITYTAAVAATLVRPDGVSVDCSHPIELHANVSAVPLDHDNPNSKSIAEFVRREFNITQTKSSFGIGLQNYRSMAFSAKRGIPASIAFEVIAFSGEKETLIGLLCAAKGTATLNFAASTEIVGLEDREFDLQLRFSRDAARECKVPNPWVGEVDLGPFYLEPLPPEFRRSGGQ